jgi:hypothetical protein
MAPKATRVEQTVIKTERGRSPLEKYAYRLDVEPPGVQPCKIKVMA